LDIDIKHLGKRLKSKYIMHLSKCDRLSDTLLEISCLSLSVYYRV